MPDKQPTLKEDIDKYCSCCPSYIKLLIHIIVGIFIVIGFILFVFLIFLLFPGIFVFPTIGDFKNFHLYEEMYYGSMTQCFNITNITFHPIPPHYTDRTKVSFNGYTLNGTLNNTYNVPFNVPFYGYLPVEPLYNPEDGLTYGEILDILNDIQNRTFDCYVDNNNILRRIGNENKDWNTIIVSYIYGIFSIISFILGAGLYGGVIMICLFLQCYKNRYQFTLPNNTVNGAKDKNGRPICVRRKSFELESVA